MKLEDNIEEICKLFQYYSAGLINFPPNYMLDEKRTSFSVDDLFFGGMRS